MSSLTMNRSNTVNVSRPLLVSKSIRYAAGIVLALVRARTPYYARIQWGLVI